MASISKLHIEFYNSFSEVENLCRAKLGVTKCGVVSYVERLNNTKNATNREETLKRLKRYLDAAAFIGGESCKDEAVIGISKADIRWLNRFRRALVKKRDALSRYLRRARRMTPATRAVNSILLCLLGVVVVLMFGGYALHLLGAYDKMTEWLTALYNYLAGVFGKK